MRRMLALLLALLVLMLGCAGAEGSDSAYGFALEMAASIPEMQDVRRAPLADAADRAIWTDRRIDENCALAVWKDADAASVAAVRDGTRYTSVRVVGCCTLSIDSKLSVEIIDSYAQVLAAVLGVDLPDAAPDYILNVNTKRFHLPGCSSVDEMKESNRQAYTGKRDVLIQQGYDACKRCCP